MTMTNDTTRRDELLAAGWEPGTQEDADYWWIPGSGGWGRTLDEAYDILCAERERKEDMHDADHAAHRPA